MFELKGQFNLSDHVAFTYRNLSFQKPDFLLIVNSFLF